MTSRPPSKPIRRQSGRSGRHGAGQACWKGNHIDVQHLPQRAGLGRATAGSGERPARPSGRWRGSGQLWRDHRPVHRGRRAHGAAGPGLLPADRQLSGEDIRRRQDPRRLLQARGPAGREGDPDLAADRPADPAAVPGRLQERDPGHLHRAGARSAERSRHRRDDRRERRADDLGHSVPGPDRRRPGRLQGRRVPAQSDPSGAARQRARPGGRRHARRGHDGRVGGQGAARGDHARGGAVRPGAVPAGDRRDHRRWRRPAPRSPGSSSSRTTASCYEQAARAGSRPRLRQAYDEPAKQARHELVEAVKAKALEAFGGEDGADAPARARPVQEAREEDRAQRDPRYRPAHRRPRHRDGAADRGRGRRAAAGPRQRRCSPAARPRRWWSRRSAPARTSR